MKTYLVTVTRSESCTFAVRAKSAQEAENAVENADDLPFHWDDAEWTTRAYEETTTDDSPDYVVDESGELADPED